MAWKPACVLPIRASPGNLAHGMQYLGWSLLATRRNQRKKRALSDMRDKYNTLLQEHNLLLRRHEESQQEGYEVAEHLRAELLDKGNQIMQLKAELVKARQSPCTRGLPGQGLGHRALGKGGPGRADDGRL